MSVIDNIIIITIAIVFNMFTHYMASVMFKDYPFQEKYNMSVTLLFICGIMGLVIGKLVINENKYKNNVVSNGLYHGGIILIISGLLLNWNDMNDVIKLTVTACAIIGLIFYSYKKTAKNKENDNK